MTDTCRNDVLLVTLGPSPVDTENYLFFPPNSYFPRTPHFGTDSVSPSASTDHLSFSSEPSPLFYMTYYLQKHFLKGAMQPPHLPRAHRRQQQAKNRTSTQQRQKPDIDPKKCLKHHIRCLDPRIKTNM